MTDRDYTHYVLLVDHSGSMEKIATETEAGIAAYLKEQAAVGGKATYSLYEFDSWFDDPITGDITSWHRDMRLKLNCVADFAPIATGSRYVLSPRGRTPLFDAQGMTITEVGAKLAAMPEGKRPGKVVFVTATDGQNNDSREWDPDRVKALVGTQERDYGWRFAYIGANQDAFAQGSAMGMRGSSTMNYRASHVGTRNAWAGIAAASTRYVGGQSANIEYTDDERDAAEEK